MGTTANFAFPYPAASDAADGPTQIQALATALDTRRQTDRQTAAFLRATTGTVMTTADTNYMIGFNAEDYDNGNGHDNTTNNTRWTVPTGRGGTYLIQGGWSPAGTSTGNITAQLYKNAAAISGTSNRMPPIGGGGTIGVSTRLWIGTLAAADYIELGAINSAAGLTTNVGTGFQATLAVLRLTD